jgi:hypothetical protein
LSYLIPIEAVFVSAELVSDAKDPECHDLPPRENQVSRSK